MGLKITLEDEFGVPLETVFDPTNLLHRLLRPYQGHESLLGQIDWYGNTVFNRIQMPLFLSAWRTLTQEARTAAELALLDQVMLLAKRCEDEVHIYIKFIGD
jgi:hypothetical protein